MQIPDGLYIYEFVLLVLGVILFIALLIMLIIFAAQKRSFKGLLPFFILPIVMIGFPGYQKFSYDNGVITIEKLQRKLAESPNDSQARQELKDALVNIENKNISNPETLVKVSKGYATIGDSVAALTFIDKALSLDSTLTEAKQIRNKLDKPNVRIEKITNDLMKNPTNSDLRDDLEKEVTNLPKVTNINVKTFEKLAETYAVVGDTNKVLRFTDSLLKITPNSIKAVELKRKFTRIQR